MKKQLILDVRVDSTQEAEGILSAIRDLLVNEFAGSALAAPREVRGTIIESVELYRPSPDFRPIIDL